MPELLISDLMRFWSKVDRKNKNECWNWESSKNENGYGKFCINYKLYKAHRVSYFIKYNKDPRNLLICHKCNNPSCVNPYHLFSGTHKENIEQAVSEGRSRIIKGSKNQLAKLQESEVIEIKKLKGLINKHEVAKRFHVASATIYDIWADRTWSHI